MNKSQTPIKFKIQTNTQIEKYEESNISAYYKKHLENLIQSSTTVRVTFYKSLFKKNNVNKKKNYFFGATVKTEMLFLEDYLESMYFTIGY